MGEPSLESSGYPSEARCTGWVRLLLIIVLLKHNRDVGNYDVKLYLLPRDFGGFFNIPSDYGLSELGSLYPVAGSRSLQFYSYIQFTRQLRVHLASAKLIYVKLAQVLR
jgi:hypothetical protein